MGGPLAVPGQAAGGGAQGQVALYWPDRRNRDVDNIKSLLDACTGILWLVDGQIIDLHLTKAIDRINPRVEMTINV